MIKLTLSLIVLIITYFLIFTNRRIRTTSAFFGAILTIILGLITFDKAITYIDFNKLGIIIGMMIFTIIAKESGIFQYLALKVIKYSKGNPLILLITLSLLAGFLSSILDEITTLLFLANITLAITFILGISSLPFLISEIIFSNIGGLATYIGTPVDIMIGSAANLNFYDFIYHMTPISLILVTVNIFYLINLFKDTLRKNNIPTEIISRLNKIDEKKAITNPVLFKNSLLILSIVLIASFFSHIINLNLAIIYLSGAIILLIISQDRPDEIYAQIDWRVIFFLMGLNILAGTLVENGLIEIVSSKLLSFSGENLNFLSFITLGLSTFMSSFFDNIPIVALTIPIIKNISHHLGSTNITVLWWALALGTNIGANGTLIGTASNLIVADIAEKNNQPIPFWYFVKIAFPLVILNLIIASIYIYLRYLN
ncbi:MAG: SLC13 family permease [Candidatus Caldatribacteriota bacterium]|nr:SLC13 family permease [Candidatus Caldatribacteriota bacterium]